MAFKPITVNTPAAQAAHIMAADDAAIYEAIVGEDRVLNIGSELNATVITNNKMRISDGVAVVGGHIGRLVKGDYEDMTIENGVSGQKRNDLIVARFLQGATDTYTLAVVKGASGATATDPAVTKGDLYAGAAKREFPLWRICLEGLSIVRVQPLFEVSMTNKDLSNSLDALNSNLSDKIVVDHRSDTGLGYSFIFLADKPGYVLINAYNYGTNYNSIRVTAMDFNGVNKAYTIHFNANLATNGSVAMRYAWAKL